MASLTKKVINGRPYYYLRESGWVNGRPKVVKTTYLGRAEDIERRLAEAPGEPKSVQSRSFGAVAGALRLCRELEVSESIDRALGADGGRRQGPSVGKMIMLAAINRACKPRSKRQLADWHARTALVRLLPAEQKALSSQRFWDAMDVVSDEAIATAETEIVRRCIERYEIELRPLIYDTTNFATFIDSSNERNTIAQRGHPKGGRRDLRLIGLALCVALDSNIPLCHQTYEGNRNDTTQFPAAIELIKTRLKQLGLTEEELSELTLVYDKGNNSKANQPLADELSLGVVGSLSPSHHPELLDVDRAQFSELEQLPGTLAYRTEMEVYGQQRTIVVSHSQPFAAKQRRGFQQTLAKAHRELDELKGIVERGKHRMDERALEERVKTILKRRWLKDVIAVEHDLAAQTLTYRTNPDAIEAVAQREWGKRIIFTGRHEWSDAQIIAAYRAQSKGENAFRQDKDREFVSYSPAFHWTDQKLKVHGFYCTLALMIVSLIERQIRHAGIHQHGLPLGAKLAMRLLNEINEVTLIYPPSGGKHGRPRIRTRLAEMDETQQQLYEALHLSALAPKTHL
jgi:transposase